MRREVGEKRTNLIQCRVRGPKGVEEELFRRSAFLRCANETAGV